MRKSNIAEPSRFGLSTQLLGVLLAFGAIPLLAAISVGFITSRAVIRDQASDALSELVGLQTGHLGTEIGRQRLLLRTIVGQLPRSQSELGSISSSLLSSVLRQSLPEDGVFDGLRVVDVAGRTYATVALRNTDPRWPAATPATDWSRESVVVHREQGRVLAYLLAVPLADDMGDIWLEGHVRSEDFGRRFAIPPHLLGNAESGILQRGGGYVLVPHLHAALDLSGAVRAMGLDGDQVSELSVGRTPSLVAAASIPGTDWVFAAALPMKSALAPLSRTRNIALVLAAVIITLIGGMGLIAARYISTPLRTLSDAARSFGETGVPKPLPAMGSGEIRDLVSSFNRMTRDLSSTRTEIERLHSEELERAQQLATVGELASGVAHEIRNPLTGVLGALGLARDRLAVDDPIGPLLEEAENQLRRIDAATTQLLTYARPPELRQVTVDSHLIIERSIRIVTPRAENSVIEIDYPDADLAARVTVDPELMVQVLVNLLLNAIQASSSGSRVTITTTANDEKLDIAVTDHGNGIPPENRAAVFRPFFTSKPQGTGLGLSISRQIVARHGGTIQHHDTPGGGATFVVTLPRSQEGDQ